MMENSVYSVISPESCAAIIWRDSAKAELAAEALRLTAEDLLNFGLIDSIIPEPPGGAQEDPDAAAELMRKKLRDALEDLGRLSQRELVEQRYKKFRRMGNFFGVPAGRSSLVAGD
jgi:acetyl-CoA carboxylase carboxyl transferase subunit alpha